MRQQGIGGDKDMSSGHKHADGPLSEFQEEAAQPLAVFFIQDRETWERAPLATVKGRRNPPDAADELGAVELLDGYVLSDI